jgi:hypothetical protein
MPHVVDFDPFFYLSIIVVCKYSPMYYLLPELCRQYSFILELILGQFEVIEQQRLVGVFKLLGVK